ncbi:MULTISPECIES: DUF488 domain-containing protein [Microbacterium]|uniref:DUF488 domain-containing protein n=1 Tax=Microbacterium TaxID=33882 RepID=UPI00217CCD7E|nr:MULTISPECIES: DUF488 family protein [Microbacterium]UWF77364.1 DUF488 family protein [Microbacterium neungamense]WCM55526.1 DUF488 family protein [Microbacterium sp. EF45047]
MDLRRKRAYDTADPSDGFRVLVDRLWPRGISKERAAIDLWAKDTAPSPELRRDWRAAADAEWETYADRYRQQLAHESAGALDDLATELRGHPVVTLVYAAHDPERTHAAVLEEALRPLLNTDVEG